MHRCYNSAMQMVVQCVSQLAGAPRHAGLVLKAGTSAAAFATPSAACMCCALCKGTIFKEVFHHSSRYLQWKRKEEGQLHHLAQQKTASAHTCFGDHPLASLSLEYFHLGARPRSMRVAETPSKKSPFPLWNACKVEDGIE